MNTQQAGASTQETTKKESNSLIHRVNKIVNIKHIYVTIRLDDQCKNGHQDFAITGDIYEAGKPKIDRYHIGGGCIHDDILKYFPEFEPFVNLHLCDYKGAPMHASANMHYNMREGFNKTKPNSPKFLSEYCSYYRITESQFKQLQKAENEIQFALLLEKLDVLGQWEKEAKEAIKYLEKLTGVNFLVDSVRGQYIPPTSEQRAEEAKKVKEGYYTEAAKQAREELKKKAEFDKLEAEYNKEVEKHKLEYEVKKQVLTVGGSKALSNCIFYNHTKTLTFNWRSYDILDEQTVNEIIEKLNLPSDVSVTNAKGR